MHRLQRLGAYREVLAIVIQLIMVTVVLMVRKGTLRAGLIFYGEFICSDTAEYIYSDPYLFVLV